MLIDQIANQLVQHLRVGNYDAIYDQLFDQEKVRHIEPQSEHFPELAGVKSIKEKDAMMMTNIESVQGLEVGEAIISKDHFAVPYKISLSLKDGNTLNLDEIIVYKVEDEKIVLEQFFY